MHAGLNIVCADLVMCSVVSMTIDYDFVAIKCTNECFFLKVITQQQISNIDSFVSSYAVSVSVNDTSAAELNKHCVNSVPYFTAYSHCYC